MVKNSIIEYLTEKYHPHAFFLFGSYYRDDYDEFSDFDCLLIVDRRETESDNSVFEGVALDCLLYTVNEARRMPARRFERLFNSELILDDGIGRTLKRRVEDYVREYTVPQKHKEFLADWYRKTLCRIDRDNDDANFRALRILVDSLRDYFQFRDLYFHGPPYAVKYLKTNDPKAYALYHRAITDKDNASIVKWIEAVLSFSPAE